MNCYWLIEVRAAEGEPSFTPLYYTAPGIWGSAVDLATKFHTEEAAKAEAKYLQPPRIHQLVASEHAWVD